MSQPLLVVVSYSLLISRKELESERDEQGTVLNSPVLLGARDPLREDGGVPGKWGVLFCPTLSNTAQPNTAPSSSQPVFPLHVSKTQSSYHSTLIS